LPDYEKKVRPLRDDLEEAGSHGQSFFDRGLLGFPV
jgi:hypothetical protein